jgi:serine/threonine kinase 16
MHRYRLPAVSATYPPTREADDDPLVSGPSEPVFDHDEELGQAEEGELIPYAHRDIKPGCVAGPLQIGL